MNYFVKLTKQVTIVNSLALTRTHWHYLTVIDFKTIYLPDLQARVRRQKSKDLIRQEMDLQRLHEDIVNNQGDKVVFSVNK